MNRTKSVMKQKNVGAESEPLLEEPECNIEKPMPSDFANFIPWACIQLPSTHAAIVNKYQQQEYGSATKLKGYKSKTVVSSGGEIKDNSDSKSSTSVNFGTSVDKATFILAIYEGDNLVQIRFDKNHTIPRVIMKLVGLTVRFQVHLTTLTISKGLDGYVIYEISHFLPLSHITDICFDGCTNSTGNFHLLLEKETRLRNYSLSRCKINDEVVKNIAFNLQYMKPASKTLALLNLASNHITDVGAAYLAEALRTNRRLYYLNLSDNFLTGQGAHSLFSVLMEFPLTSDEIIDMKVRHLSYLKQKANIVKSLFIKWKTEEADKKLDKRRYAGAIGNIKSPTGTAVSRRITKVTEKESSDTDINQSKNAEAALYEKAGHFAISMLGEFDDPYSPNNTAVKHEYKYCKGNNTLCFLNMAYNDLCYSTLCKLLEVLAYQKMHNRKPRGLVNVVVDGNNIPVACKELYMIDDILLMGLIALNRRQSIVKKKLTTRTPK